MGVRFVYPLRKKPKDLLAYVERRAVELDISFRGDEWGGSFSKTAIFVTILSGSYVVKDNEVHLTIDIIPTGWDRERVDLEARKLFGL